MEKLIWPERLRNLATLLVIIVHVSAPIAMERTDYDSTEWWAGNFWCSIGRPAVPLFVMLSGYLLLVRTYSLREFLTKRFTRVVVPAIFWIAVYSFYNFKAHHNPATLVDAVKGVIEGPVHYHLWFLYLIIGLYLTYPVLAPFVRQADERDIWYFLAVCLFGTWGVKTLNYFVHIDSMLYIELFTNNAIYFVGGYYLALKPAIDDTAINSKFVAWKLTKRQIIGLAAGMIIVSTAITAYASWSSSKAQGSFFGYYYDYLSPLVTCAAVGWFMLVKYTLNNRQLATWETDLAAASFGIYLVHPLVRDWWSEAGYWQDRYHPAKCIPIIVCLVLIASFIAVMAIRVIPGGKKIT